MDKRAWAMSVLILAELAGLAFAYQIMVDFTCSATDADPTCGFIRSLVARAVVVMSMLLLFVWLRKSSMAQAPSRSPAVLAAGWQPNQGRDRDAATASGAIVLVSRRFWLALHFLGLALLLAPLVWAQGSDPQPLLERSIVPWALGSVLAAAGAVLWIGPVADWRSWVVRDGYLLVPLACFAFIVPDLAALAAPLWHVQALTTATFAVVAHLLRLVGTDTYADPLSYVIGLEDFHVHIAQQCSGVEGLALTASFVTLYGLIFHKDLRVRRYWIAVLPLALVASWLLNAVRIFGLILLGAWYSPTIAVNGFHSYAGWMLFTILAVTIVCLVHATPALRKRRHSPSGMPLREDWLAARILPFTVLLASGVAGAAFTLDAELAAPYRALVLGLVIAFFWPHYRRLNWSPDLPALVGGTLVGLIWVWTAPEATNSQVVREVLGSYGPIALSIWVLARMVFTTALVPLAEELFFRGYLLGRLDFGGLGGRLFAIVVSSAFFALLHGRWLEAGAAGVVFAMIMLRRNRVEDAIVSHGVANGIIALSAARQSDWTII